MYGEKRFGPEQQPSIDFLAEAKEMLEAAQEDLAIADSR